MAKGCPVRWRENQSNLIVNEFANSVRGGLEDILARPVTDHTKYNIRFIFKRQRDCLQWNISRALKQL